MKHLAGKQREKKAEEEHTSLSRKQINQWSGIQ